MSQSDLYDFFSYVARDGKGNTYTAAEAAMTRRTSVMSSSSSSSSDSSAPTPASTTTRATATATPAPFMLSASRTSSYSSSSASAAAAAAAAAVAASQHRLTADEITARILQSPEHHALCEMLSGRHDHDDDYARRSADKYRAFVDLATRLEAQKMPSPPPQPHLYYHQHEQARREWNSSWW